MELEKTDQPDVLRDKRSGALINTNSTKLNGYKLQKQKMRELDNLKRNYSILKKEHDALKQEFEDLKTVVAMMLPGPKGIS